MENLGLYVVFLVFLLQRQVLGSGRVEVLLVRYSNPGGEGDNGNYCDGMFGIKRSDCDHQFDICLDWESNGSPAMTSCDVGFIGTGYVHNADEIDFTASIGEAPDTVTPNPLIFSFNTWNSMGLRIKVDVSDDDSSNDNDHVELLPPATVHVQLGSDVGAAPENEKILAGRTSLTLRVKAYCNQGWYGQGCSVQCTPHDDTTGHYTCSSDGSRICLSGWEGVNCDTEVATTTTTVKTTIPEVATTVAVVETTAAKVETTAKVESTDAGVETTAAGVKSTVAEVEIVHTTTAQIVAIQDTTVNPVEVQTTRRVAVVETTESAGRDSTETPVKPTEAKSEIIVTTEVQNIPDTTKEDPLTTQAAVPTLAPSPRGPCTPQPCLNNATCEEARGDSAKEYVCMCEDGYEGYECQTVQDNCASDPCQHGTCENQIGSFICHCEAGWQGNTCLDDVNECDSAATCLNGATCINTPGSHLCTCGAGWRGDQCGEEVPCACQHGGSCVYSGSPGAYDVTCTCVGGWSGVTCQISPCAPLPCQNQGVCTETERGFVCGCQRGFSGDLCVTNINECESNPCQNEAPCVDGVDGYSCACTKGFKGAHCESVKDLADKPYEFTFDGEMTGAEIEDVKAQIAKLVSTEHDLPEEELSVEQRSGFCERSDGSSVTLMEVQVLDEQGERLKIDDMTTLLESTGGKPFTEMDCSDALENVLESKDEDTSHRDMLRIILCVVIGLLCIVLIVLIVAVILYHRKKDKDDDPVPNPTFRYREVPPTGQGRAPRSFRCHSDDEYPSTKVAVD